MSFAEDVAKWIAQGNAYFEKGNEELDDGRSTFEMAEQFFDRALCYDPTNEAALGAIGLLYISTARGPLAMKRLNRTRKEFPDALGPYRAISLVMRISGKLEPAIEYFKELLVGASSESKPFVLLSLAELYASKEDISSLRQTLQLLSEYPPIAPVTQGLLLLEENDQNGIKLLADKVPAGSEKETLLGMCGEARNDWSIAGQHYFNASTLENPTWYSLNALAGMWLNSNEIAHCKNYLTQVEAIAPNAPEVILTKARLYQKTGKLPEARKLKDHLLNLKGCFGRVRRLAKHYLR
jgi:tetratricopeptide (TPR) repeat protein